jgi:hypothetical protein
MRRYSFFALPLFLLFLLQACAPRPVFRMKPIEKRTSFYEGTEYVHRHKNNITFTISYDKHYGDKFAMDVEIDNNTDSVLRVSPGQFWYNAYQYYNGKRDPRDSNLVIGEHRAMNPEHVILKKDLKISKSHAHQQTSALLYGIGQVLTVTAGAVTDSTNWQRQQTIESLQDNTVNYEISKRNRSLRRQSLRDQQRFWRRNTIRKTDLYPGEYIEGLVFFKNNPHARGYMFHYKIGGTRFRVFFTQKEFNP